MKTLMTAVLTWVVIMAISLTLCAAAHSFIVWEWYWWWEWALPGRVVALLLGLFWAVMTLSFFMEDDS